MTQQTNALRLADECRSTVPREAGMMWMAWIRKRYGVPVKRGARVEYTGNASPQLGTVTSAKNGRIRIRMDGDTHTGIYHPTWEIRYLAEGKQP